MGGTAFLPAPVSTAPRPKGRRQQKKPKRSSEQVRRGAAQAAREQRYREWYAALGTGVEGNIEDEDAFLAEMQRDEE